MKNLYRKRLNLFSQIKNIIGDIIYYNLQIPKKQTIIMSILIILIVSTLAYLLIDMRRIKIEYAREVWELNQYYRQKEKELNIDSRIFEEEFNAEKYELHYYREGIR